MIKNQGQRTVQGNHGADGRVAGGAGKSGEDEMSGKELVKLDDIRQLIYTFRGVQVMIDRDLSLLCGVETRVLNQAVKRNQERFPEEFCFLLSDAEFINWKSQIVISNKNKMGIRRPPYAFTEQYQTIEIKEVGYPLKSTI